MPKEGLLQPQTQYVKVAISAGAIIIVAATIYALIILSPRPTSRTELPLSEAIRQGTAPRPPLSESDTIARLSQGAGFQALVSYTDGGFEPQTLTITSGDTVRFANNSSELLLLVVNAETMSEYDLAPQHYVQITFTQTGTFTYATRDATKIGNVRVQ